MQEQLAEMEAEKNAVGVVVERKEGQADGWLAARRRGSLQRYTSLTAELPAPGPQSALAEDNLA